VVNNNFALQLGPGTSGYRYLRTGFGAEKLSPSTFLSNTDIWVNG